MSAIDLPPGLGLEGTPLGTFRAPVRARRLASLALSSVIFLGSLTWYLVSRHPWQRGSSTQIVLPVAFAAFCGLGWLVRRARVAITRDGIRWGWTGYGFHQGASSIAAAHIYADGVALQANRGSWWFLSARDWEKFEVLAKLVRRTDLTVKEHAGRAPIRARLQSYGRFLDALLVGSVAGAAGVALWAA